MSLFWASQVVWWLRFHASTAGGMGALPDHGSRIPHGMLMVKKKKKERYYVTFLFKTLSVTTNVRI